MRKLSAKSIHKFITNRTGKHYQNRTCDHYRNRIQKDYQNRPQKYFQNRTCKRLSLPRCGFSVKVEQIAIFRLITGFN